MLVAFIARKSVLRFALSTLSVTAALLTGIGLIIAAALKNDHFADAVLSSTPRYRLAMQGLNRLKDLKYPVADAPNHTMNVSILSIDNPEWPVLLDFLHSESAIRKSERNNPPLRLTLPPGAPNGDAKAPSPQTTEAATSIDFDRLKTMFVMRIDVISAGDQALAPPYRLSVLWPFQPPQATARTLYEFLSFEEFYLDLRKMVVGEWEELSLWIAVVAFAISIFAEALGKLFQERTVPGSTVTIP